MVETVEVTNLNHKVEHGRNQQCIIDVFFPKQFPGTGWVKFAHDNTGYPGINIQRNRGQ